MSTHSEVCLVLCIHDTHMDSFKNKMKEIFLSQESDSYLYTEMHLTNESDVNYTSFCFYDECIKSGYIEGSIEKIKEIVKELNGDEIKTLSTVEHMDLCSEYVSADTHDHPDDSYQLSVQCNISGIPEHGKINLLEFITQNHLHQ